MLICSFFQYCDSTKVVSYLIGLLYNVQNTFIDSTVINKLNIKISDSNNFIINILKGVLTKNITKLIVKY